MEAKRREELPDEILQLVAHRLDRYRAGRRMDFDSAGPDAIAQAIAEEIDRPVDYRPVETDAAARVAAIMSERL